MHLFGEITKLKMTFNNCQRIIKKKGTCSIFLFSFKDIFSVLAHACCMFYKQQHNIIIVYATCATWVLSVVHNTKFTTQCCGTNKTRACDYGLRSVLLWNFSNKLIKCIVNKNKSKIVFYIFCRSRWRL